MELLSETRTPQQALNYAVNRERERGLADQQEIHRSNHKLEYSFICSFKQTKNIPPKHTTVTKSMLEMRRNILFSSSTNMPCKNNIQNMQKSWTLHIIVYSKDARTPATTHATIQHGTKLQTTTNKKRKEH